MKTKNLIVIVAALLMPLIVGAQTLKGSYFLDNSLNRNKMNPAFAPRSNYFQMPVLGNFSAGMMSNVDAPNFIYKKNGEYVTFLSNQISAKKFDRAIPNHPHFDVETSMNLINFGFFTEQHSFWTVDIGMRTGLDIDLPANLFTAVKNGAGSSGGRYNIGNANVFASSSLQAAVGYSRDILDGLRIGAKLRAIVPVGYAAVKLENIRLETGKDKWTLETDGQVRTAVKGLEVTQQAGEKTPDVGLDLERMLGDKIFTGFGYSVDLGAEYILALDHDFFNSISFSAAITDLGLVHYSKKATRTYSVDGYVEWAGVQNSGNGSPEYLTESINELVDESDGYLKLDDEKASGMTRSTMPNFYLGVEVPFLKNKMSAGLLYSGRFSHGYYRNELTAALNVTPADWVAIGVNYSFLNTARTLGAILELTPKKGVNFFIGFDYLPLAYNSDPRVVPNFLEDLDFMEGSVPRAWSSNLHFGLSFALGSEYGR